MRGPGAIVDYVKSLIGGKPKHFIGHNPAGALAEFHRVTATGGRIILTTPNSYALLFRLLYVLGLTPQRLQRSDHLHFFNLSDIGRLCPETITKP